MKKVWLILLAFIITLSSAMYQRITGPTYPRKDKILIDGKTYHLVFIRSHTSESDAPLKFNLPKNYSVRVFYKRYPSDESWQEILVSLEDSLQCFYLPKQPPAGKLEYYITIIDYTGKEIYSNIQKPVIIRFKGKVPLAILLSHILFMFLAMFFSTLAGIYAIFKIDSYRSLTFVTIILLFIGGLILGPIVQKYAFGAFWTGVPFGWDLTDNKTLIIFLGWLIAALANYNKPRRGYVIFASVLMLVIYLIPHSLYGSQLDYKSGKVVQG